MIENLHLYRQYDQISVSYLFAIQIKNWILCLKFITNLCFWGQFQWLNEYQVGNLSAFKQSLHCDENRSKLVFFIL
jgi:hypothetical protein